MSKKRTGTPSAEKDIKTVKELIDSDELEALVAQLDPADIHGSLENVPVEVIRLLVALFTDPKLVDQLKALKEDHGSSAQRLLELGLKFRAREFVAHLISVAAMDPDVDRRLGLNLSAAGLPTTAHDAKTYNTITGIAHSPILMLKSSRLYSEVAFFQDEDLLLRSTMELDELVAVASALLETAANTISLIHSEGLDVSPKIARPKCERALKEIRRNVRRLTAELKATADDSGDVTSGRKGGSASEGGKSSKKKPARPRTARHKAE